ncbi:MAG: LamG domain-containing protein [Candidatus Colwellbacteria bacterium]|nr:LamG domain-containing protein [Candidatus Colwellbacteria bacterium]
MRETDDYSTKERFIRSFTLVELLIVIAILAVLAAAVVIVLNPAELLAQARDSQRVTDMKTMKDAIDLFVVDNPTASQGTAQTVYISIPDTSSVCANITGLPLLPAGWSYHCVTAASLRTIGGSGWVPLDLSTVKGGSPIPFLPIDPSNDALLGRYYAYISGGSYVITAFLESEKSLGSAAAADGGMDPARFEVGNDLRLWGTASQLAASWTFDEGSGTTVSDISGNGRNGIWSGGGVHYASGNFGMAGVFTGDDFVTVPATLLNGVQRFTVSVWAKSDELDSIEGLFSFETAGTSWRLSIFGDYVRLRDNDGLTHDIHLGPLSAETWHNFVFVYNGASAKFTPYVDGVSVGDTSCGSAMYSDMGSTRIGSALQTEYNFSGLVDDFRIYYRPLSASEVKSIYLSGK